MTHALLDALVPIFAGLLLGYCAGSRGWIDNGNVRNLIVLVMNFAVPSALFAVMVRTPRDVLKLQGMTILAIAIGFGTVYLLAFFFARWLRLTVSEAAVVALTFGFSNSAAIAVALLTGTYGLKSAVSGALSIAVGATTISPVTLTLLEAGRDMHGSTPRPDRLLLAFGRALRRPVVCSPLLAFLCVAANVHPASFLMRSLDVLGSAGTGSALVLTGVILSAQRFQFSLPVAGAALLKILVEPAAAIGAVKLLHLPAQEARNVVLICAIPGGFFGLVFGKSFGVTPRLASSGLIATYVLSLFTLPLWIVALQYLFPQ